MDMWVGHAARRRNCINCTQGINPGDPVIYGQWKRTYPWGTRTRRVVSHWKCWVVNQETYLDDHPYEPRRVPGPGAPRKFTDIQRKRRMILHTDVCRWTRKQQHYTGQGMWAMAGRYGDKVAQARDELESMVV